MSKKIGFFNKISTAALAIFLCVLLPMIIAAEKGISQQEKEQRKRQSIWERDWDENERQRDERFHIDKALDTIGIHPGMTVGEVGGGFGYIVFKLADRVGPKGKVYNEDIWEDALKLCEKRMAEKGYSNIEIILGTKVDAKLPKESLDYVFIHATMHFLEKPVELLNNIASALKTGGKLVIIEQEKGRAVGTSGDPASSVYSRTKQEFLDLFSKTVFKVDRIDVTTLPYDMIFVLSVKSDNIQHSHF